MAKTKFLPKKPNPAKFVSRKWVLRLRADVASPATEERSRVPPAGEVLPSRHRSVSRSKLLGARRAAPYEPNSSSGGGVRRGRGTAPRNTTSYFRERNDGMVSISRGRALRPSKGADVALRRLRRPPDLRRSEIAWALRDGKAGGAFIRLSSCYPFHRQCNSLPTANAEHDDSLDPKSRARCKSAAAKRPKSWGLVHPVFKYSIAVGV